MAIERTPITLQGYKKLQDELHRLKTVERPKLSKAIEVARAHGDLSENAEYHAAKDAQGLAEARIRVMEANMSTAQVVDVSKLSGTKVVFGATVLISDVDTGEEKEVMIVGEEEADADRGRISLKSPLARGLIGKELDDLVLVPLPGGKKEYEILSVTFKPTSDD